MKRCAQGAWRGGIYSSSPPSGRDSPGRARRCAGSASAARFRLQLLELPRRGLSVGRPAIPLGEPRQLRSEEHTSELQSQSNLVGRLLLEKKKMSHCNAHTSPTTISTLKGIDLGTSSGFALSWPPLSTL